MRSHPFSLIVLLISLLIASVLDLLHLPTELMPFRPHFTALILIYWLLFVPWRVGVFTAWLVGLWVDALHGNALGIYALAFAIMAYCVYLLHQRVRVFPLWQQAAVVGLLIAVKLLLARTLLGIVDSVTQSFAYYWPVLTSALIWPWCVLLLHRFRRV